MLAVLGFLGIAMSSFAMIGRNETEEDDSLQEAESDTSGLTEIGPDLFQMLSDSDGDAGAGGLSDTDGDAGAGGVLAEGASAYIAIDETLTDADWGVADGSSSGANDDISAFSADEPTLAPDTLPQTAPAVAAEPDLETGPAVVGDAAEDGTDDVTADDEEPADDQLEEPIITPPLTLTGTDSGDTLDGGLGDDTLFGGLGDDDMTGNMGRDTMFGDAGNDTLQAGAGDDTLFGGDGDDTLAGGWGDDSLTGGNGNDLLQGGWGNDVIDGRDDDGGFDYINGGAGDDTLLAGAGDHLNGGDGFDTFVVQADGNNTIDDFNPAEDVIEITYSGDVPPVLTTTTDADGTTLLADDTVVARLSGVTMLDTSTILLVAA
ncbi:calcium-binding protein [Loktanella salsilacus]|uniref:calcium-binding protein n=1 Tax=Loktanella salsilacus TaxID=195913 RepID=UPI003735E218